jgi:DNA-binding SARP family transcriptional activator
VGGHCTVGFDPTPDVTTMLELNVLGTLALQDADGRLVTTRPRPLALLAYLALARPRGAHSREALRALLWPEADRERAQRGLRQTLYMLRRAAGQDLLVSGGVLSVAVDPDAFRCDALAFEAAVEAGRDEEALALYGGELLAGLHLAEAVEWERWVDLERERLHGLAVAAARAVHARAEADGRQGDAEAAARRWTELAPFDDDAHQALMGALARAGRGAAAVAHFNTHEKRLSEELEVEPSPETAALAAAIRDGRIGRVEGGVGAPQGPSMPAPVAPRPRARTAPALAALAGALAVVLVVASAASVLSLRARGAPAPAEILAVGVIEDPGGTEAHIASVLPDLLATGLARMSEGGVVSVERMQELMASAEEGPGARADAARRAYATSYLDGVLTRDPAGGLRLDLRRTDTRDGRVRDGWTVRADDPLDLVDRAVRLVANGSGVHGGDGEVALGTRSLVAARFYQEGLRAFYTGEEATALALFDAALHEDPDFAMAAYYGSLATDPWLERMDRLHHARELARNAPRRDQLLIEAGWAWALSDPSALTAAQAFAARFPEDPESALLLQRALDRAGRYAAAVGWGRRAIDLARAAGDAGSPRCRACSAYATLYYSYVAMDSMAAAVRVAREWAEFQPASVAPLRALSAALRRSGEWDEALHVRDEVLRRGPAVPADHVFAADVALRQGDMEAAHRVLDGKQAGHPDPVRRHALWWKAIVLRNESRWDEALSALDAFRELAARTPGFQTDLADTHRAIVLQEMGQYEQSAQLFRETGSASAARAHSPGYAARQLAWHMTHAATSLALAGDTTGFEALADTVRVVGVRSGYVRDALLHHHIRGLLWEARGDAARAADAYFKLIHSPTESYAVSVLRLARILVDSGRPHEAVDLLDAQLRGPMESVGLYVPRSRIVELRGEAWLAAERRSD